jgi:two-component system, OmpR family, sensor histidine kinase BaeS
MRFRFAFVLSLILVGAVTITVLTMGGVTALQLRSGFSSYLQQRDLERLDRFVEVVGQTVEREGGIDALRDRRITMRQLIRELGQRESMLNSDQNTGGFDTLRPPPQKSEGSMLSPEGEKTKPPPPPAPESFPARVGLFELDGRPLFPRPLPESNEATVERVVNVFGKPALLVRFAPINKLPAGEEASFLNSQYRNIATLAALLCAIALAVAYFLGRKWAKSLGLVKNAVRQIAQGDFSKRLPIGPKNEIGDVMNDINLMASSLSKMDNDRKRWVADISHELRTPLAILRGEVEAMLEHIRPYDAANLNSLREEIIHLNSIIDDLHLLSMADIKALPCHFAEEDATEILQSALARLKPRLVEAGIEISPNFLPDAKLPVYWDSTRIQQVLINLLENSLKYTNSPGKISVSMHKDKETVYIEIADSAPGVPAVDIPKLFTPLYQANSARSRSSGGSGLGMAICESIVKSHHGRITATNSSLGGLSIRIALPTEIHYGPVTNA